MRFGFVNGVNNEESSCSPAQVSRLATSGVEVVVTRGSAYNDADYVNAGAQIADSAEEIYSTCDFVAQVQECAKQRC